MRPPVSFSLVPSSSLERYELTAHICSENTLIGAINDETERVNSAIDFETGEEGTIPEVAKKYKARGQPWMIVTDVRPSSSLPTTRGAPGS